MILKQPRNRSEWQQMHNALEIIACASEYSKPELYRKRQEKTKCR
jgi:hypothetical protein